MRRSDRFLQVRRATIAAASSLLLATSSAFAAGPKVIGTVTFVGRAGLDGIPVVGFTWAARSTALVGGGGGGGAGKAVFDPFLVVKFLDATSPALFDLTVRGTMIPEVHVDVNVRRGTTASYVLSNVLVIANERHVPESGGAPLQELSLTATAVRETLVTPGGTVTTCFDVDVQKACE